MPSPFNINEATAIAIHAMVMLAKPDAHKSAKEIAEVLGTSLHHTIRVMHQLRKLGYVRSIRGPTGGFQCNCDPDTTSFLDIYEAMEGSYECKHCILMGENRCPTKHCLFSDLTEKVDQMVIEFFRQNKLSQKETKENEV